MIYLLNNPPILLAIDRGISVAEELLLTKNVTYVKIPPNIVVVSQGVSKVITTFLTGDGYGGMSLHEYLDAIYTGYHNNVADIEDMLLLAIKAKNNMQIVTNHLKEHEDDIGAILVSGRLSDETE